MNEQIFGAIALGSEDGEQFQSLQVAISYECSYANVRPIPIMSAVLEDALKVNPLDNSEFQVSECTVPPARIHRSHR